MFPLLSDLIEEVLAPGARVLWRIATRRPFVEPNHHESARSRAHREFHLLVTNTVRFALWAAFWTIAFGAIGLWASWGHGRGAAVGITTGAAVVGVLAAFCIPFSWLWVTAPLLQRNEARAVVPMVEAREKNVLAARDRDHREAIDHLDGFLRAEREKSQQAQEQLHLASQKVIELEAELGTLRTTMSEGARRQEAEAILTNFIWDGAVLLGESDLTLKQVQRWGIEVASFLTYAFGPIEETKFIQPGQPINEEDYYEGVRTFMDRLRETVDRFGSLSLRNEYSTETWYEKVREIRADWRRDDGYVAS